MDYSALSILLSCPRQYQHSRVERLRAPGERMAHAFGKVWHAFQQEWALVQMKGLQYEQAEVMEWVLNVTQWKDSDDYRTAAKLRLAAKMYFQRYATEPFLYMEAEQSFTHQLAPGLEPVEGRIDALVAADAGWGDGMQTWLVDYKTCSQLRGDWVEYYRVNNQFKYYYINKVKAQPEIAGVCVDVFHATPGNKRGKTEGERAGNRFYRLFFKYTEMQLREAIQDFAVANTTREMYQELGYWPKNTSACHQFGVTCAFLELCDAPNEEIRAKLMKGYDLETFSPHDPVLTEAMG